MGGAKQDAIVEFGSPLGGGARVADGAVSASDSDVSGYSIVQAAELFRDHPHLGMPADSAIEILEFLPLPGT